MKYFISLQTQARSKSKKYCDAWRRGFLRLLVVTFAVIFFSAMQAGAYETVVGMDDNGMIIEMRVGEILQIDLPGNAGTGFSWHFDILNGNVFTLLGSDMTIEYEGEPYVGNPYLQSWFLQAENIGVSSVRLLYYRPWEGKAMAEKEFNIEVVINP